MEVAFLGSRNGSRKASALFVHQFPLPGKILYQPLVLGWVGMRAE